VRADEVGPVVIDLPNKLGHDHLGPMLPMHGEESRPTVYAQVHRSRQEAGAASKHQGW